MMPPCAGLMLTTLVVRIQDQRIIFLLKLLLLDLSAFFFFSWFPNILILQRANRPIQSGEASVTFSWLTNFLELSVRLFSIQQASVSTAVLVRNVKRCEH